MICRRAATIPRKCVGLIPVSRRNERVKWLWSANPVASPISAIGASGLKHLLARRPNAQAMDILANALALPSPEYARKMNWMHSCFLA